MLENLNGNNRGAVNYFEVEGETSLGFQGNPTQN